MEYLNIIKQAFIFFPIIAFIFTIPFILKQYHKYGSINKLRVLIVYSFILYLMTIYFLVILPLPSIEYVKNLTTPKVQLIPFKFITDFINETPLVINNYKTYLKALMDSSFYTVVFNILMFIPFGMYLRYYYKCDLKKTLLYSFLLSLFFELTQLTGLYFIYPRPYRLFDVDDLIINTLGGFIGYQIMGLFTFLPSREKIDKKSIEDGKIVSPLRRIVLFVLDLFLYEIIYILIHSFFNYNYINYIVLFIYYVIIPFLNDGMTLAGKFLNVKIKFKDKQFLNLLLRLVIIYLYYYYLPLSFVLLKNNFVEKIYLFYILILFLLIPIFYFLNIIFMFKNKKMFYDKILNTEYISTINIGIVK